MLVKDLEYKLMGYDRIPRGKQNKAMKADIKLLASERAFHETMYKLGITQGNKQYTLIVTDEDYFKKYKNHFKERNSFKLTKSNIVYKDKIEQDEHEVPRGKRVHVYVRDYRDGWRGKSSTRRLEVVYVIDGELYVI